LLGIVSAGPQLWGESKGPGSSSRTRPNFRSDDPYYVYVEPPPRSPGSGTGVAARRTQNALARLKSAQDEAANPKLSHRTREYQEEVHRLVGKRFITAVRTGVETPDIPSLLVTLRAGGHRNALRAARRGLERGVAAPIALEKVEADRRLVAAILRSWRRLGGRLSGAATPPARLAVQRDLIRRHVIHAMHAYQFARRLRALRVDAPVTLGAHALTMEVLDALLRSRRSS